MSSQDTKSSPSIGPSVGPRTGPSIGGAVSHLPFEARPFSTKTLGMRLWFGTVLGATTGAMYGGWDAVRNAKNQKLAGSAAWRFGIGHTAKVGAWFTGFFALYQGIKYGLVVARKEDDLTNCAIAGLGAFAPLVRTAVFRSNAPYAVGLLILDAYHDNKFGGIDTGDTSL